MSSKTLAAVRDRADGFLVVAEPPEELASLENIWAVLAARLGIDPETKLQKLGSGLNGTAYLMPDGQNVLKITKDSSEAEAMAKLIGKKPRHVVEVSRVIDLEGELFCIVQEKVDPPAQDWVNLFETTRVWFSEERPVTEENVKIFEEQWRYQAQASFIKAEDEMGDWSDINPGDDAIKLTWPDRFDDRKIKWLYGLANELIGFGITFHDMNDGNIMRRGTEHVLIDLGMSEVTGGRDLETLASVAMAALLERAAVLVEAAQDNKFNDAFWKWFGDSKVVDSSGKPLIVYHGTSKDADFKSFRVPARGVFFTTSKEGASLYASENESRESKYDWDLRKYKEVNTTSRVIPCYLSIQNPFMVSDDEYTKDWVERQAREDHKAADHHNGYKKLEAQMGNWARARGYDGICRGGDTWIVLKDQGQIKSAIGNSGAWDFNKKNIAANKKPT